MRGSSAAIQPATDSAPQHGSSPTPQPEVFCSKHGPRWSAWRCLSCRLAERRDPAQIQQIAQYTCDGPRVRGDVGGERSRSVCAARRANLAAKRFPYLDDIEQICAVEGRASLASPRRSGINEVIVPPFRSAVGTAFSWHPRPVAGLSGMAHPIGSIGLFGGRPRALVNDARGVAGVRPIARHTGDREANFQATRRLDHPCICCHASRHRSGRLGTPHHAGVGGGSTDLADAEHVAMMLPDLVRGGALVLNRGRAATSV